MHGRLTEVEAPTLLVLNQDLRTEYISDCGNGVVRWNRILAAAGLDDRLQLPHRGFNRKVGVYAGTGVTPDGQVIPEEEWERQRDRWLPSPDDLAYVASLMHPVFEPGKIASWVAPPSTGINGQSFEYEYVHLR